MKEFLLINFLCIASFSGFVCLFLIKSGIVFLEDIPRFPGIVDIPWAYMVYLAVPLILAYLSVFFLKKMSQDDSLKVEGNEIVPVEGNFLPTYIGMYVIALSLPVNVNGILITLFLFILWFRIGTVAYFNPFLSLLGYRYYAVKSTGNKTITIITKEKDIKQASEIKNLVRINNYTFFRGI